MDNRIAWRNLAAALAAIGAVACATAAKYDAMLAGWIGRDGDALVDVWGYPDREVTAPNGNRVFVYDDASLWQTPLTVTPAYSSVVQANGRLIVRTHGGYVDGGDLVYTRCSTYFEVDESMRIVRTKFKGNACKSR